MLRPREEGGYVGGAGSRNSEENILKIFLTDLIGPQNLYQASLMNNTQPVAESPCHRKRMG